MIDARQYAPATQRNRDAIWNVLVQVLPKTGTVLEVSSGTGEHGAYFAPRLPTLHWLPSDPNPFARASIAAWRDKCAAHNLLLPINLKAEDPVWVVENTEVSAMDVRIEPIVAIANINMIHIAPWSACLGLMAGAGRILPREGILFLYGPYKQHGSHTADSNVIFDRNLRSQNPEWGVRDLEKVITVAHANELSLLKTVTMPANNLSVIFQHN